MDMPEYDSELIKKYSALKPTYNPDAAIRVVSELEPVIKGLHTIVENVNALETRLFGPMAKDKPDYEWKSVGQYNQIISMISVCCELIKDASSTISNINERL